MHNSKVTHSRYVLPYCLVALYCILSAISCTKAPKVATIVILKPEGVKRVYHEPKLTYAEQWKNLVLENKHAPIEKKLALVNEFFNRFDYVEDKYLWGQDDFWATLPETLEKSGGDCEDVSIAKFFTLGHLDIPLDSLRITYVYSLKTNEPHMVLTFTPDRSQEPIVLDSLNNYLFPVSKRSDLIPVYSFNTKGYWLAKKQDGWKGKRLGNPEKLSMWKGVLQRMRESMDEISGG